MTWRENCSRSPSAFSALRRRQPILGFGQVNALERKRDSGHKHGGAVEAAGAKIGQGLVGVLQRIGGGVRHDSDFRRLAQEFDAVVSSEIGDREKLTLFPEQRIGKARNVAHVNPGANDAPAFANGLQRQGDKVPNGCEDDRRIELLRRRLVGAACPSNPERPGEVLGDDVSGSSEGEYGSPLPQRDLRKDMGCGTEAIEAELLAVAGNRQ